MNCMTCARGSKRVDQVKERERLAPESLARTVACPRAGRPGCPPRAASGRSVRGTPRRGGRRSPSRGRRCPPWPRRCMRVRPHGPPAWGPARRASATLASCGAGTGDVQEQAAPQRRESVRRAAEGGSSSRTSAPQPASHSRTPWCTSSAEEPVTGSSTVTGIALGDRLEHRAQARRHLPYAVDEEGAIAHPIGVGAAAMASPAS